MEYRRLGRSGLEVSTLCLGAMMFGDRTGEDEATRIVRRAGEAGVNFLDTADAYAGGESERIVGRAIQDVRDRWIVAIKVGTALPPSGPNRRGSGRVWVLRALEQSLRRLQMDHVDICYLHLDDLDTPLEETVATMGDLIQHGKIRHWGVSNFRAFRIAEIIRLCGNLGAPRPSSASRTTTP